MKLLIDPQVFWWQKTGGVSRYFFEVISKAEKISEVEVSFPVFAHENQYIKNLCNPKAGKLLNRLYGQRFRGVTTVRNFLIPNRKYANKEIARNEHDVLAPTFFEPYFLNENKKPIVLTIHDMTHELFPQFFKKNDPVAEWKRQLAFSAEKIIAISENTKRDILDIYGDDFDEKTSVVYNGNDFHNVKPEHVQGLPDNYFLYVGARVGYKNFNWLINEISDIIKESNCSLLCIGGGAFSNSEKKLFHKLGVEMNIKQMSCSDSQLAGLYERSSALIYPSLYEGFGMPVLEAMSHKCPVILSKSSSFPEVAGKYGHYFESDSDLHDLVKTFAMKSREDQFLEDAKSWSKNFNWDQSVQSIINIYRQSY